MSNWAGWQTKTVCLHKKQKLLNWVAKRRHRIQCEEIFINGILWRNIKLI